MPISTTWDPELEPGTIKDISGKQVKFKQGLWFSSGYCANVNFLV